MSGGLGFGSGFAQGIARAYTTDRQRRREDDDKAYARMLQEFNATSPILMQQALETGDYTGVNELYMRTFPDMAKRLQKDSPFNDPNFTALLGKPSLKPGPVTHTGGTAGAPGSAPLAPAPDTAVIDYAAPTNVPAPGPAATAPPVLESRTMIPQAGPANGPDPKSMFLGQQMASPEERATRKVGIDSKVRAAEISARRAAVSAADAPPELKNMSPEDKQNYILFGDDAIRAMASRAAMRPQSIAGEIVGPDGTVSPAFGVFVNGRYVDPDTGQPIENFRPRTTTGSGGNPLGVIGNRAAVALGYQNAAAAIAAGKQEELTAKVAELQQNDSLVRGRGTGQARIETELDMPIGTTASVQFGVPPTTSLRELRETVGLTPADAEKIAGLRQVDQLIGEIDSGLALVFPDVEPGIWGRIKTQLSLGAQKLAADEDMATLDANIQLALGEMAKLAGQSGVLSTDDVRRAEQTLAQLTPQVFGGDTLASARARLGVVKRLLETAKANTPRQRTVPAGGGPAAGPAAPAAAPAGAPKPGTAPPAGRPGARGSAPAGPPGITMRNGVLIGADGKPLPGQ
jgi:hypothetical protein